MKITKIKIDGYKNVHETELDLGRFNALVALNNYGKSNVIEAIEFSMDFIKYSNKGKTIMMQNNNSIPINNITAKKDFSFEIEFETKFEKTTYEVHYLFSFEWLKKKKKGRKINKEILRMRKKEKNAIFSTYIQRDQQKSKYLSSKSGRCDKDIVISSNGLIVNKLANYDDLFYLDIINKINNIETDYFSLSDIERYFSTGFIFDHKDTIDTEPSYTEVPSIAKLFYTLKEKNKEKYSLLINSIIDLLPDIEYIEPVVVDFKVSNEKNAPSFIPFELPEKAYDLRVKVTTNNQDTSIRSMSLGTKRIFLILAMAVVAEQTKKVLVSFEELENSIHPALLQRLIVMVSEMTTDLTILITSHSPYLIKYLDLEDINLGVPNAKGIATFKKIKESKRSKLVKYAEDAESNIGEFIFDMLVEGFDEDSFWNDFI